MRVSVVIPTYNRYTFLKRALESVFTQTLQPCEVIVVDDGSLDKTAQIQKDFPQIRYIYQKNSGVSAARNTGVLHVKGEWIAFLDSDDVWFPQKLEKQTAFHKQNPHILMSYTDEVWIRENQKVKIPKKFFKVGRDVFLENISYCNIAPSSVLIAKTLFEDVGGFDTSFEVCEDYDLWLRISAFWEVGLVREKLLVKYAGHDDQLSFRYWGMDRWRTQALEKLFATLTCKAKQELVKQELTRKYALLMQGAQKYDKIHDFNFYRERFEYYRE